MKKILTLCGFLLLALASGCSELSRDQKAQPVSPGGTPPPASTAAAPQVSQDGFWTVYSLKETFRSNEVVLQTRDGGYLVAEYQDGVSSQGLVTVRYDADLKSNPHWTGAQAWGDSQAATALRPGRWGTVLGIHEYKNGSGFGLLLKYFYSNTRVSELWRIELSPTGAFVSALPIYTKHDTYDITLGTPVHHGSVSAFFVGTSQIATLDWEEGSLLQTFNLGSTYCENVSSPSAVRRRLQLLVGESEVVASVMGDCGLHAQDGRVHQYAFIFHFKKGETLGRSYRTDAYTLDAQVSLSARGQIFVASIQEGESLQPQLVTQLILTDREAEAVVSVGKMTFPDLRRLEVLSMVHGRENGFLLLRGEKSLAAPDETFLIEVRKEKDLPIFEDLFYAPSTVRSLFLDERSSSVMGLSRIAGNPFKVFRFR